MRSKTFSLAVAALVAIGLTGCIQDADQPGHTPSPSSSHSESPSISPSPGASSTLEPETPSTQKPDAGFDATPVTIGCNTLVNAQAVYDYNPNYGLQPDFTPSAGTDLATIAANKGVVCHWVHQTSGETFDVAVAQLGAKDLASLKSKVASTSTKVSGLGEAAWFTASGDTGVAEVFSGPYWIVGSSAAFYEVDSARPLLGAALDALGR